jgi:SAM-dependent methyltransferase
MTGNTVETLLAGARKEVARRVRQTETLLRHALHLTQPEARLTRDAQTYWTDESRPIMPQQRHWRGAGPFADEERWLALGRENLALFDHLAPTAGLAPGGPLGRVVDWGCGGGANAVHFAPRAEGGYVGVDVARPNLDECSRQLQGIGAAAFTPVLIDAARPEGVLERVPAGSCDLFHCLYVFEIFPSPEYGLRVVRIAHALLRQGGAAFVQIRFDRGSVRTAPRRWGYVRNQSDMATWRAEAFWEAAQAVGFAPQAAFFLSYQPLNQQSNYAYFLMTKRRQPAVGRASGAPGPSPAAPATADDPPTPATPAAPAGGAA